MTKLTARAKHVPVDVSTVVGNDLRLTVKVLIRTSWNFRYREPRWEGSSLST